MLDTDYPYFPASDSDAAPMGAPTPLANWTGLAGCFLALRAKKRAGSVANFLLSRLKTRRCTRVRIHSALSRGDSRDEVLG